MSALTIEDLGGGINLIDIGSGWHLGQYWNSIKDRINLIGFDPNARGGEYAQDASNGLHTARYLPVAVAGESRQYTLYQTRHGECWSLLEPNASEVDRFEFSEYFTVDAKVSMEARRLDDIAELKSIDIDAIKTDTQGLDLPILRSAGKMLDNCFLVEVETAFLHLYRDETLFHEMAEYLTSMGFMLFDMNIEHRIARKNPLGAHAPHGQILWCESVWLRDYLKLSPEKLRSVTRHKALKSLLLCANHGCPDYGYELAELFQKYGQLSQQERTILQDPSQWELSRAEECPPMAERATAAILSMVPGRIRRVASRALKSIENKPHPIRHIFPGRR